MLAGVRWAAGLTASAGLHVGAAALFVATQDLQPPPQQSGAKSQFELTTVTAPSQSATAQTPEGTPTATTEAQGSALNAGAIPQSKAAALPPSSTALTAQSAAPSSQALAPAEAEISPLQSLASAATTEVAEVRPEALTLRETTAAETALPGDPLDSIKTAPITAQALTLASTAAPAQTVQPAQAQIRQAPEATLPTSTTKAATAWAFGDRLVTDPTALATIQAFMAPSEIENADQVRDDLSSALTHVDCARLQATFLPETGTLEMQGHIPDPALRDGIVAALQAQVGEGVEVTANLLHLPSPQCNALKGISDVGLPQSTDQFTNERLIGASPHARAYTYSGGQRLQFDLVAPDYDAFVYVDYFAADGTVIHLRPNEHAPLVKLTAKSLFGIGTDDTQGLLITIGPPYGQEIAVAFAASHDVFDQEQRPIVEPAEPYLADLKDRVAKARSQHPDFKGEWVYFFITTQPEAP